jgi:hypothetical protein
MYLSLLLVGRIGPALFFIIQMIVTPSVLRSIALLNGNNISLLFQTLRQSYTRFHSWEVLYYIDSKDTAITYSKLRKMLRFSYTGGINFG